MDPLRSVNSSQLPPSSACPICGKAETATNWNKHEFTYGTGASAVEISVDLPIRRCEECEFEYLDEQAEKLKHDALCVHLGVLSPADIRRIREKNHLSRARFAQITGIGEASLNRWENGLTVQTHAYDRYLRLLDRPEIMRELEGILANRNRAKSAIELSDERFPSLTVNHRLLTEQHSFRLLGAA